MKKAFFWALSVLLFAAQAAAGVLDAPGMSRGQADSRYPVMSVNASTFGANTAAVQSAINSLGSAGGFATVNRGVSYSYTGLTVPVNVALFDEANSRFVFSGMALEPGAFSTYLNVRAVTSNSASRLYVMPRGAPTGVSSAIKVFATDYNADQTNYADFGVYFDGTAGRFRINSKNNGTVPNQPVQITFQDGLQIAAEFTQNTVGGITYGETVLGGAASTVSGLTRFNTVPVIFAANSAFANNKFLRWYNTSGTDASAGFGLDGSNNFRATAINGTAAFSFNAAGVTMQLPVLNTRIVGTLTSTTFSAAGSNFIQLPGTGSATVTDFTGGQDGQLLYVLASSNGYTLQNSATLRLSGGANFTPASGQTITLIRGSAGWFEVCRSLN